MSSAGGPNADGGGVTDPANGVRGGAARGAWWWPGALMVVVFLCEAVPLWAVGYSRGKGAFDQRYYHVEAIDRFAREWPRFDFSNYESATTPGYHVVMAWVWRAVSPHEVVLQVVASVFTLGLLGLTGVTLGRRAREGGHRGLEAAVLGLPLVATPYVFMPGVWLQPDNLAWLLVLSVLLCAGWMARCGVSAGRVVLGGVLLVALVLVRQSHVWAAGLVWVGAWMGAGEGRGDESVRGLVRSSWRRVGWTTGAVVASVPAVLVVLHFARLWGGLVPPRFQTQIGGGPNWATPAFCLSLIGLYGVLLWGWTWGPVVRLWRESRAVVVLVAGVALVAAVIPETTFLRARLADGTLWEPRASGLWNVVRVLDGAGLSIAGRTSPLLVVLAPVGAVVLAGLTAAGRTPWRWALLAAVVGMTAAQTANPLCWQRYVEPLFLMVIPMMALGVRSAEEEGLDGRLPGARWVAAMRVVGPCVLAAGLGVMTGVSLARGERLVWPSGLHPAGETGGGAANDGPPGSLTDPGR